MIAPAAAKIEQSGLVSDPAADGGARCVIWASLK